MTAKKSMQDVKVVILGGSGFLGEYFHHYLQSIQAEPVVISRSRPCFNCTWHEMSNIELLKNQLEHISPMLIINCAAIASHEKCEAHPEKAFSVNAYLPSVLARWCNFHRIKFIQISSDSVFSGSDKFPFSETSDVSPIGIYAQSKMKGEKLVMLNSAESIICRTNFLVGIEGVKGLYTSFTIT